MAIPQNIPVSSIRSITSSITSDAQVYRWFLFLVRRPEVKMALKDEQGAGDLYRRLGLQGLIQILLAAVMFGLFVYAFLAGQHAALWVVFFLAGIFYWLRTAEQTTVSRLGLLLLNHDFSEEDLSRLTLYQLAEKLAGKYHTPSLIDVVYHVDDICRKLVIVFLLLDLTVYLFVYQFNLWANLVLLIGIYWGAVQLFYSPLVYQHFKK